MKVSTRITLALSLLGVSAGLTLLVIPAVTASDSSTRTEAQASVRPAAITSFPGLEVAGSRPWLTALETASPVPGSVAEAAGPFDDRFEFHDLAFTDGVVTGEVLVTSDVSEILELEVLAGFYDDGGALVGDAAFVLERGTVHSHADGEGGSPLESYDFEVVVPTDLAASAVSAAVGVPVLVNE